MDFIIGLVGNDRLRLRIATERAGDTRGGAHQIGVIGNIGNNGCARLCQQCPEGIVNRTIGLDDVGAGITLRLEIFGEDKIERQARVNECVLQQYCVGVVDQLADGFEGVAQAPGEPVGVPLGQADLRHIRADHSASGCGGCSRSRAGGHGRRINDPGGRR